MLLQSEREIKCKIEPFTLNSASCGNFNNAVSVMQCVVMHFNT